jgi:hypothetical protein
MQQFRCIYNEYKTGTKVLDSNGVIADLGSYVGYGYSKNGLYKVRDKEFFIDKPKGMFRTFISDPKDNKAYCEVSNSYQKIYCPAFEYIFKLKHSFSNPLWIAKDRNGKVVLEQQRPGLFSSKENLLSVEEGPNQELLIYALFYFDWYSNLDGSGF